jgi:uncharacterized protein YecE (DUF72 family)
LCSRRAIAKRAKARASAEKLTIVAHTTRVRTARTVRGSDASHARGTRREASRLVNPARAYIGTSGWSYASWKTHFYSGVPRKRWLVHAASQFTALEVNGSFYSQIRPETYAAWAAQVPAGFRFAVKGHRFITHYKQLRDVGESVERVLDQASPLGDKLAVVVWQLPASRRVDLARLDEFLAVLARNSQVRHALEVRHRSWFTDEVAARLTAARVANCLSDAPDFPLWPAVTTDLVYVRLHGHTRKYASSYSHASLRRWAASVHTWLGEGRDVHVYFDNDAEGHAVTNARTLLQMVGEGRARDQHLHT